MIRILPPGQQQEWLSVLDRTFRHDFYHLPGYHALAEQRGEGEARLLVYEDDGMLLAIPLMLRPVEGANGNALADGWRDATSVYGYAGPLASHEEMPAAVVEGFQSAMADALRELRVVSVFSRLHPLIPQQPWLAGLGECRSAGQTIALDLSLPPAEQRAQFASTAKNRINQLRRSGVTCIRDHGMRHLRTFVDVYHETMRRVGAHDSYFFDEEYFTGLAESLGSALHLFMIAQADGEFIGGSLIVLCDGIVQYHLCGTRDRALELSPMRLLIDEVRLWANAQGARVFHLGGGVGSARDSLFNFKCSFSKARHDFATWRWILEPEIYRKLEEAAGAQNEALGLEAISQQYFPAYRCPARPRVAPVAASEPLLSERHG